MLRRSVDASVDVSDGRSAALVEVLVLLRTAFGERLSGGAGVVNDVTLDVDERGAQLARNDAKRCRRSDESREAEASTTLDGALEGATDDEDDGRTSDEIAEGVAELRAGSECGLEVG